MEWLSDPNTLVAFATLVIMETVLGIDNIVFITIMAGKVPPDQQKKARFMGMGAALIVRIVLLLSITWIMTLTTSIFNAAEWFGVFDDPWHERFAISGRDLVLLVGGLFLIYKANVEISDSIEGEETVEESKPMTLAQVVIQIGLLDLVFGLDSVITAVGMADHIVVMIAAVIVAMAFMLVASSKISGFIAKHPTVKLLALAFLLLIGVSLVAEGIAMPIPKGFIYFAMAFSIFVETLILRFAKRRKLTAVPIKDQEETSMKKQRQ